jgi:hypothetical protein
VEFARLEKNICDVIKEEQVKLGYRKEVIRLYYPLQSLNRFLKTSLKAEEIYPVLHEFAKTVAYKLGTIEISNKGDRFCFTLPPVATEYVHNNTPSKGFIYDFIKAVSEHGTSLDNVLEIFYKYSGDNPENVVVEKKTHGEFDCLVYFKDGNPDDFRYCLTDEGCHVIYHRFTIEDYEDFGFDN